MKSITRVFTILVFCFLIANSFESRANVKVIFSNAESISDNHNFPDNLILGNIKFTNSKLFSFENAKKPWWLVFVITTIEFGMNIPDCSCCYNGICSIGRTVPLKYESEAQLAKYLNETGNSVLAVDDKNEVYILVGSKNNLKEFKDGFALDYLPNVDASVVSGLASKGVTFPNLKKNFQYKPTIAAAGYKMIKLN